MAASWRELRRADTSAVAISAVNSPGTATVGAVGQTGDSGLRSVGNPGPGPDRSGFTASFCDGPVRVQDCEHSGSTTVPCAPYPAEGHATVARARDCTDVSFSRSLLIGSASGGGYYGTSQPYGPDGPGLDVQSSRVAVDRLVARGGFAFSCPDGSHGGDGAVVSAGSEFFAHQSTFTVGNGGSNSTPPFGYGGNGLTLRATCPTPTLARTLVCTLTSGQRGFGNCSLFCGGLDFNESPGLALQAGACATREVLTGTAPSLECAAVVREGLPLALLVTRAPGDRVWVRIARATGLEWDPLRNGVRLVEGGLGRWMRVAELGASGQATSPWPTPLLPVGEQARVFHMQVQAERPNGSLQLGSARSVVIVDSAF